MTQITTKQAAALLKMSDRNVRHHFALGRITGRRVTDRMILLDRASVMAFKSPPVGRVPGKPQKRKRRKAS